MVGSTVVGYRLADFVADMNLVGVEDTGGILQRPDLEGYPEQEQEEMNLDSTYSPA